MENMHNKIEDLHINVARKIEFWKGIMVGSMAGMAIAAFTYSIADPAQRGVTKPRLDSDQIDQKPDSMAAA